MAFEKLKINYKN